MDTRETSIGNVPMCRVKDIADIGPDRRRLIDGFEVTSSVTAYPMIAGHDTERRRSLACNPDSYLSHWRNLKVGFDPDMVNIYGKALAVC